MSEKYKEMKERKAKEFNELIDESRYRRDAGKTFRESLEPNPHGYNVAQIIGITKGNGLMFSKEK